MDYLLSKNTKEGHGIGDKRNGANTSIFNDDVVQSMAQPSMIGIVTKVGGEINSEDSENEDEDHVEIPKDSAQICWINSKESIELVKDICVLDRGFLHGDIVAKASDPLGQMGTVVNMEMMVDLKLSNGNIIKDVNTKTLQHVRALGLGDYIISKNWLGRINDVIDIVTILFDDGSKCKITSVDPSQLHPCNKVTMDNLDCPYFQGQRVCFTSTSVLKSAKWLKGSWKAENTEGTILDVEAGFVLVDWCAAGPKVKNTSMVPNQEISAKKVKALEFFPHTNWQLGDHALSSIQKWPENSTIIVNNQPTISSICGTKHVSITKMRNPKIIESHSCWDKDGCKAIKDRWSVSQQRGKQPSLTKKILEENFQNVEKIVKHAMLIVKTRTIVDVEWQDGTLSQYMNACSLVYVDNVGDHDFWPGQYIIHRGIDNKNIDCEGKHNKVGVIKVVDEKQRTAIVRWLKNDKHDDEPWIPTFEYEELISVYELFQHPNYSYSLGDVVIRLWSPKLSCSHVSLEEPELLFSKRRWKKIFKLKDNEADSYEQDPKNGKNINYHGHELLKSQDTSWVGIIIGLTDGSIEVAWADGTKSKVGPQTILIINHDDESSSQTSDTNNEDCDDSASWKTTDSFDDHARENKDELIEVKRLIEVNESLTLPNDQEIEDKSSSHSNKVDKNFEKMDKNPNFGLNLNLPNLIYQFISQFITKVLYSKLNKKDKSVRTKVYDSNFHDEELIGESKIFDATTSMPLKKSYSTMHNFSSNKETCVSKEFSLCPDFLNKDDDLTSSCASQENTDMEDLTPLIFPSSPKSDDKRQQSTNMNAAMSCDFNQGKQLYTTIRRIPIKHFDCIKDPSNHHFVDKVMQLGNNPKWMRRIHQEWSILESNLPDTVFIRVYEDRMDLLQAAIVGVCGTPYHNGIFIFDLYLPFDYPSVPPLVYFHAGGLRLNPNLYEDGKVCLSLLNTWTGKDSEIWHPSTSTIFQILISIQSLVLNENPYYNEAGYERQIGTIEGDKKSLIYNENSFLFSCKSMLYLLRRPPRHFEDIIEDHFRKHGQHILSLCNAYLAGARVGSLKDRNISSIMSEEFIDQTSTGFKLMLKKMIPELLHNFKVIHVKLIDSN